MSAKAQSPSPKTPDPRLRSLIDRVGGIDLIANIRSIREARDFLDSMLGAAEAELSGRTGQVRAAVAPSVASGRAIAANRTRHEAARRAGSSEALQPESVAAWAAAAIRQAGKPLHTHELVKVLEEQGHKVKVTTLLGSLYRWIKKKSVFYLARPGTFGLVEMRKG